MRATADSWKHLPFERTHSIPYAAQFSPAELARLRDGLIPQAMEDKWFIYFEEPHLYLHRSWTGQASYRVSLAIDDLGARVQFAESAYHDGIPANPEYEAQLLHFLIANLVLGQSVPFPRESDDPEAVPGLIQHVVAGAGYKETTPGRRPWWRFWR